MDKALGNLDSQIARLEEPSPLDALHYDGKLEDDTKAELSETLKAFKEQAKAERKTVEDNTDSEFWFCVCFQNREQKEAFLALAGWLKHGDKYLDGVEVAKALGFKLPEAAPTFNTGEVEKSIAALPRIESVKGDKPGQK